MSVKNDVLVQERNDAGFAVQEPAAWEAVHHNVSL